LSKPAQAYVDVADKVMEALGLSEGAYPMVWRWKCRLPERKGQRCRVMARGTMMNSCAVQFEDGHIVVTSRWAVRRAK
jgi:hypothetical protein